MTRGIKGSMVRRASCHVSPSREVWEGSALLGKLVIGLLDVPGGRRACYSKHLVVVHLALACARRVCGVGSRQVGKGVRRGITASREGCAARGVVKGVRRAKGSGRGVLRAKGSRRGVRRARLIFCSSWLILS